MPKILTDSEIAKRTLQTLTNALETYADSILDVDFDGAILTTILPDDRTFVLHFHAPTAQIWMSSPLSGAHHFKWAKHQWRSTRGPSLLETLLSEEIAQMCGSPLTLAAFSKTLTPPSGDS